MTSTELSNWILNNYGRGQRLAFVADYNATAEVLGAEPVSADALNHWLYDRKPPAEVRGMNFSAFLELVLQRKQEPSTTARIYNVTLPVDAATAQAIDEIAGESGVSAETFLRTTLYAAVGDEVSIHRNGKRKRRKN
jgi:hypothetical protein